MPLVGLAEGMNTSRCCSPLLLPSIYPSVHQPLSSVIPSLSSSNASSALLSIHASIYLSIVHLPIPFIRLSTHQPTSFLSCICPSSSLPFILTFLFPSVMLFKMHIRYNHLWPAELLASGINAYPPQQFSRRTCLRRDRGLVNKRLFYFFNLCTSS